MRKRAFSLVLCLMLAFGCMGLPAVSANPIVSASSNEKVYQRVASGDVVTTVFETINYSDIEINTFTLTPALPTYTSGISCGVTALG